MNKAIVIPLTPFKIELAISTIQQIRGHHPIYVITNKANAIIADMLDVYKDEFVGIKILDISSFWDIYNNLENIVTNQLNLDLALQEFRWDYYSGFLKYFLVYFDELYQYDKVLWVSNYVQIKSPRAVDDIFDYKFSKDLESCAGFYETGTRQYFRVIDNFYQYCFNKEAPNRFFQLDLILLNMRSLLFVEGREKMIAYLFNEFSKVCLNVYRFKLISTRDSATFYDGLYLLDSMLWHYLNGNIRSIFIRKSSSELINIASTNFTSRNSYRDYVKSSFKYIEVNTLSQPEAEPIVEPPLQEPIEEAQELPEPVKKKPKKPKKQNKKL